MPSNDYLKENSKSMFDAILKLKTSEECELLFKDMCTSKELAAIAQRYMVAKMLDDEATYAEIVLATGASTATISRVKRSLEDGEGYRVVFTRLNETRGRKKKGK